VIYDGIELELWLIGETIMEHFGINKLSVHRVIHRWMMRLPMKYIRRLNKRVVKRFWRKNNRDPRCYRLPGENEQRLV
jgi:hypothetical protein